MSAFFNKVGELGSKLASNAKTVGTNWAGYIESKGNNLVNTSHHVADNTILAQQIKPNDLAALKTVRAFEVGEELEFLWTYNGRVNCSGNVIVGMTNKALFKIDNINKGDVINLPRAQIVDVNHKKSSIVSWDTLQCSMKTGTVELIGIFHGTACSYFHKHLQAELEIRRSNARSPIPLSRNEMPPSPASLDEISEVSEAFNQMGNPSPRVSDHQLDVKEKSEAPCSPEEASQRLVRFDSLQVMEGEAPVAEPINKASGQEGVFVVEVSDDEELKN